jgi:hypothetical protein
MPPFSPAEDASDVVFYLPVTAAWLNHLVLSLVLICHSSYRGVIQLLAASFDTSLSLGTIHNLLVDTSNQAAKINGSQDFSWPFKWDFWMKSFRETSRYWRALMRVQHIAISYPKRNSATKQPGARVSLVCPRDSHLRCL